MNTPNTRKGFTLVEVLVVVSIISFLSSIATVSFGTAKVRAQDAATLQVAVSTRSAVLASEADGNVPPGVAGAFITESSDPNSDWVKTWSPLANAGYGAIPYSKNGKLMFMYNYQGKEVVLGFFQNNNSDSGNSCDFFVNSGSGNGDTGGGTNGGTNTNSGNNSNESSSRADTKSQVAAVAGVKLAQTGPDGGISNPDNPDNPDNGDSGDPSCIQITPTIKFCPNVTGTNGNISGTSGSNHNVVNPKDPLDPNGGDDNGDGGDDDPFKDAVCLKF